MACMRNGQGNKPVKPAASKAVCTGGSSDDPKKAGRT